MLVQGRDWTKGHPFLAAGAAAILAFTGGAGSAGTDTSGLEARLAAAEAAERSTAADADAAAEERDGLEAQLEQLRSEHSQLEERLAKLNARRPLPKLVGAKVARAETLAERFGWDISLRERYADVRPGTILEQTPAPGTEMRYDKTFKVVVAKAIPTLADVVGISQARATKTLRAAGYEVVVVEQVSTRKPGTVVAMSPGAGVAAIPGATVTLTIARKAPPPPAPSTASSSSGGSGCTPGYSPCLPPASDYDCIGGSGDGPKYTGYVTVTGSDPYGLDSDNDGAACE